MLESVAVVADCVVIVLVSIVSSVVVDDESPATINPNAKPVALLCAELEVVVVDSDVLVSVVGLVSTVVLDSVIASVVVVDESSAIMNPNAKPAVLLCAGLETAVIVPDVLVSDGSVRVELVVSVEIVAVGEISAVVAWLEVASL